MTPELHNRVLILAQKDLDGRLARDFLTRAGLGAFACTEVHASDLLEQIAGGVGCVVLDQDAVSTSLARRLLEALASQPPWSDLPLILFVTSGPKGLRPTMAEQLTGNITILEKPVRSETLVAAVRTALRARARQYEVRDLLEQTEAANRAKGELVRRLEEHDRRKDEFLAMLGHELRNPLGAIRFALSLIGAQPAASPPARYLAVIDRQARQLERLVDDLLEVSRITRGKISLQCQLVDLTDLAMRCVQATKERAKAHTHTVSFETDGGDALVHGDPVRLEQVLTNLLVNAYKYTPKGGRIVVGLETLDGTAVLRVRDNGVGISGEMLGRIFDLFTQADRSLDRAQGGLGLGLHLARELVQLHHGTIEARSDGPGTGSEFTVRLPTVVPTESTPPGPAVRAVSDLGDAGLRVLVVEDTDDIRESLQILLEGRGHTVEVAADGRVGVQKAQLFGPDVALVDVGLPGLDGYEVARRLRAMSGGMVLIAMTGYGQPEDRRRALSAGFDEHLIKPVDIDRLTAVLRQIRLLSASRASG